MISMEIINIPTKINHQKKFNPKIICMDAAMIPKSAPILIMLAMANNDTVINKSFFEWYFLITPAKPLPEAIPILPHISCMATMAGHKNKANHASLYPY